MDKITLKPWQSALLHGLVVWIGAGVTLWLSGHPDIANMTVAGAVAAIWNALQGANTSDRSA
jgi:hypothetical protein